MKMKFCPDCTEPMDVLESGGKEHHLCGNDKCLNFTAPFDRYEHLSGMDMQQEMESKIKP